jgi:tRNA1(Val) A37 N6-methylase TrmN6
VTVEVDPRGEETSALFASADVTGRRVLEVGSGDGRLTWLYARRARHVTAVEPFEPACERAAANLPGDLRDCVALRHAAFEDFASSSPPSSFDVVILSWSLC